MNKREHSEDETNRHGILVSSEQIFELEKSGKLEITLYPRDFTGTYENLKVGQKIDLASHEIADFPLDYIPSSIAIESARKRTTIARITKIEDAEPNTKGDPQIRVTLELVR